MRTVWIVLFVSLLIGLAAGPALFSDKPRAGERLVIVSPHWDGIRHEFARAFEAHYLKKTGRAIQVEWLDIGGTGEIRRWLTQRFSQVKPDQGVNFDILFGGGMDMLPRMADSNYFEPYKLSAEQEQAIPATVNGQPLRDKNYRYHAACLSTFGFVYNTLVLERAKLPVPVKWEDLGEPAFRGWVACGDPGNSGSLHQAFELVLQGHGYEKGYAILGRMMSNVRGFNEGGTSIPRDVSLGQAAVGPCIDFYATAPVRRQGATHLQLVIPAGVAVATPDCIAIMRNPPNREAAFAFTEFTLSEAGQRLWYQARGTDGGPVDFDLERLPVMPAIYDRGYKTFTVTNPFKSAGTFVYNGKKAGDRWLTLNNVWRAAAMDVHAELSEARKIVVAAGRDHDLGHELCRSPLSEAALEKVSKKNMSADERNQLKNKWSAWARDWFAKIEAAARANGPAPEFVPAAED